MRTKSRASLRNSNNSQLFILLFFTIMQIKFRNEALQYLYILTSKIPASTIQKVRQVKAVFLKLQPSVEAFERKWEELAMEATTHKQTLDGWAKTNQLKKHESDVEEIQKKIQSNTDAIKALKSEEVEIDLNGDDCKFLLAEIAILLNTAFIGKDGNQVTGIQGKREIEMFDEVYTTLESVKE